MSDNVNAGLSTERLNKVFDIAIVLLGILAAAESQYALVLSQDGIIGPLQIAMFRITTTPFIVLIIAWIINEIVIKQVGNRKIEYGCRFFCWSLWSFCLFIFLGLFFLLGGVGGSSDVFELLYVTCLGSVGLIFTFIIRWTYGKAHFEKCSIPLKKVSWYTRAWICGLVLAFVTFVVILLWSIAVLPLPAGLNGFFS